MHLPTPHQTAGQKVRNKDTRCHLFVLMSDDVHEMTNTAAVLFQHEQHFVHEITHLEKVHFFWKNI